MEPRSEHVSGRRGGEEIRYWESAESGERALIGSSAGGGWREGGRATDPALLGGHGNLSGRGGERGETVGTSE